MQGKIRNVRVINGKERFRFYIFYCLKIWQNFEMEVFLVKERGQTLIRSSKVICQQALNRLYQSTKIK